MNSSPYLLCSSAPEFVLEFQYLGKVFFLPISFIAELIKLSFIISLNILEYYILIISLSIFMINF